ncbi:hypothetical protein BDZ89DRAFT_60107 [Hymenopellis radicata]|nr:hypothetical protein BDZ89DRAFT_60107 [Hymenopellis radicata]
MEIWACLRAGLIAAVSTTEQHQLAADNVQRQPLKDTRERHYDSRRYNDAHQQRRQRCRNHVTNTSPTPTLTTTTTLSPSSCTAERPRAIARGCSPSMNGFG